MRWASVGGMVISRDQVSIGASRVASSAGGIGARRVIRADGEALLSELGAGAHVDAGEIPEDGIAGKSVLVLEDIGLARLGGELDGDTTTIGVGLPALRVGTTVSGKGDHLADLVRNRPGIEVTAQVVNDGDTTRGGLSSTVGRTAEVDNLRSRGRERRGHCSEGSSKTEDVGEHHFDCLCLVEESDQIFGTIVAVKTESAGSDLSKDCREWKSFYIRECLFVVDGERQDPD